MTRCSECSRHSIGQLEGRALCGLHFEGHARSMGVGELEDAIAETDDPMAKAKLRDALVEVAGR